MTRLLALLVLLAGLAFAGLAQAQDAPQPIDYGAFDRIATRAEQVVVQPDASDEDLESLRQTLADWRSQLLAAENTNASTIQRLQGQIDALGPAPAADSGVTEPPEIADRRADLSKQLADAQLPRVNALEAYNRANGLVSEIDSILRARQNEALLERSPSPLMPAAWAAAAGAVRTVFSSFFDEIDQPFATPESRATLRENVAKYLPLLAVGVLLLVRGRAWVGGLANLAHRRKARGSIVFLVSLGQIFLPVAGLILVLASVVLSGLAGTLMQGLLTGIIGLLFSTFTALWLASRLFPQEPDPQPPVNLPDSARARARALAVGIGIMLGVGGLLRGFVGFEGVDRAARSVLYLPYFVLMGVLFWSFARVLVLVKVKEEAEDSGGASFFARLIYIMAIVLRVVAVMGPVLAVAGYVNAAEGLMRPTAQTFAVIGLFVALQVPIRDLYALATRTPVEEAGRALVPVLVNFALAVACIPLVALIWGARRTELDEVYARFAEGVTFGGTRITPGAVLTVILVFAAALLVTRLIQGALKSTVLPRTKIDPGAQTAIVSGLGYVGIAIAALLAINAGGIDLTALTFVISALSVGIGFGLRNVIENFVAGVILLIERPISEGDWIEVGGNMGIVKQISVRSTVIETFDKQQLIVPNGDFITGTVTNWTRGNQIGRAVVTVGVAYGTDTRLVERILLEIAQEQRGVMQYPEPGVDFIGFGADSLDFRVRAMLYDVNTLGAVKTEMHHRIVERFREEGIDIPFAQREIWIRNPEAVAPPAPRPPAPAAGAPLARDPQGMEDAGEQEGDAR